jgi:DNA-binding transcriptional LysR family regulator
VELKRLPYFVAVAEELHFRRAGERLHIAQPAVSEQVRKLELELGVQLFHRSQRSVQLTDSGAALLHEARRVLRQADEAERAARNARALGRLRVGHPADVMPVAVSRAVAGLAMSHPGVEVVPETLSARQAIADVRAGRTDVAVVGLPAPAAGLRVTSLGAEGTVAAVADRHPPGQRDSFPLSLLSDTPLVLLPRANNPAFHDRIMAACLEADIAPRVIETPEPRVEHALLMVAGGAGVALLPASAAERYRPQGVCFRPLEPPDPSIEMAVITRTDADDTAVAAFLRLLRTRPALPAIAADRELRRIA